MSHRVTSIRLTNEQFAKVDEMAEALGTNRNQLMGLLVDHAQLSEVKVVRPVATLAVNSNSAAQVSQARGAVVGTSH